MHKPAQGFKLEKPIYLTTLWPWKSEGIVGVHSTAWCLVCDIFVSLSISHTWKYWKHHSGGRQGEGCLFFRASPFLLSGERGNNMHWGESRPSYISGNTKIFSCILYCWQRKEKSDSALFGVCCLDFGWFGKPCFSWLLVLMNLRVENTEGFLFVCLSFSFIFLVLAF